MVRSSEIKFPHTFVSLVYEREAEDSDTGEKVIHIDRYLASNELAHQLDLIELAVDRVFDQSHYSAALCVSRPMCIGDSDSLDSVIELGGFSVDVIMDASCVPLDSAIAAWFYAETENRRRRKRVSKSLTEASTSSSSSSSSSSEDSKDGNDDDNANAVYRNGNRNEMITMYDVNSSKIPKRRHFSRYSRFYFLNIVENCREKLDIEDSWFY